MVNETRAKVWSITKCVGKICYNVLIWVVLIYLFRADGKLREDNAQIQHNEVVLAQTLNSVNTAIDQIENIIIGSASMSDPPDPTPPPSHHHQQSTTL